MTECFQAEPKSQIQSDDSFGARRLILSSMLIGEASSKIDGQTGHEGKGTHSSPEILSELGGKNHFQLVPCASAAQAPFFYCPSALQDSTNAAHVPRLTISP